jgi:hypothetical protein
MNDVSDEHIEAWLDSIDVSRRLKRFTTYAGLIRAMLCFFDSHGALQFGTSSLSGYGYSRQRVHNYFANAEEIILVTAACLRSSGTRNQSYQDIIALSENLQRNEPGRRLRFLLSYPKACTDYVQIRRDAVTHCLN